MAWQLLAGPILGALGGALKHKGDVKRAEKQRKLQAEIMLSSPWTGMKPDLEGIQDPSLMGTMLQGATAGLLAGKEFSKMSDKTPEVPWEAMAGLGDNEKLIVGEGGKLLGKKVFDAPKAIKTGFEFDPTTGMTTKYDETGKPIGKYAKLHRPNYYGVE